MGKRQQIVLTKVCGEHVFIQPLGEGGTYRYHALFQQFLEAKWLYRT